MRVLLAITRGEVGGAQEHARILLQGLRERGHTVGIAVEVPSSLAAILEQSGVEVLPWNTIKRDIDPLADYRARRDLRSLVERFEPDVLHLYSSKAGLIGRRILTRPAGVTVFTCHHAPFGPGRKWSHRVIARPAEQLSLRLVDGVISDGARDIPLLRKLAPRVPIALIPNAVPPPARPLGAPPETQQALWVARLQHPKDPLQAVHGWKYVREVVPDARFVLCGRGPLEDRLQRAIHNADEAQRIAHRGFVDDLKSEYQQASVFILASHVEGGITMATLEAMSHGLVPVVSDVGDAFLLEHEGAGVVVARSSPRALGLAVASLFTNPDRLARMRENAIRFATERWTPAQGVSAVETFYRSLLESA